jgi:hypothetical protein
MVEFYGSYFLFGGEGGIRTHGPLTDASLAVRYFRPLSHLSNVSKIGVCFRICQAICEIRYKTERVRIVKKSQIKLQLFLWLV